MNPKNLRRIGLIGIVLGAVLWCPALTLLARTNVYLTDVPDYEWHLGCFGTATGNLIGFWDRHGFPDLYTGPTAGGTAPLNSYGANYDIRSLWASKAGRDGRPAGKAGHEDDYYTFFEYAGPDPYAVEGRPEHAADSVTDFIGMNQNKWTNLNGECDGNIDGYAFVYWDASGERRVNFTPGPEAGLPAVDLQSGLREWTRYRGHEAEVFTQLADFNPETPPGQGFTFADLQAEIDAGYPVMVFMQDSTRKWRLRDPMERANPNIHAVLIYGYLISDDGIEYARYRTSWASGDNMFSPWRDGVWIANLPVRGLIGYHPRPQITEYARARGQLVIRWHGPAAALMDAEAGVVTAVHWYVVERATSLIEADFAPVGEPATDRERVVPDCCEGTVFFRIRLTQQP